MDPFYMHAMCIYIFRAFQHCDTATKVGSTAAATDQRHWVELPSAAGVTVQAGGQDQADHLQRCTQDNVWLVPLSFDQKHTHNEPNFAMSYTF